MVQGYWADFPNIYTGKMIDKLAGIIRNSKLMTVYFDNYR